MINPYKHIDIFKMLFITECSYSYIKIPVVAMTGIFTCLTAESIIISFFSVFVCPAKCCTGIQPYGHVFRPSKTINEICLVEILFKKIVCKKDPVYVCIIIIEGVFINQWFFIKMRIKCS